MATESTDAFPPFIPAHQHARKDQRHSGSIQTTQTRPRRKSSGLGAELPGDSTVAAFATLSPPPSPLPNQRSLSESTKPRRSKRRKVKSLFRRWKQFSLRHTWFNPLMICLSIVSVYLVNPSKDNPVYPALFLSYPIPKAPGDDSPIQYGKGKRDFAFVAFYTVFLSFTREFLMQRVIRPIAIAAGIKSRAKQSRFMEQFYTALYFAILGPFGLWVMSRTPVWYFNTRGMYEGFPHKTHDAMFKAYYLLQASYWAQQMIVILLLLEKPRKDFKELVAHHIITLLLIGLSYRFHFTYIGLAVYITMDISDFFLATSKLLNYIDVNAIILGPYFFIFICVWTYLRHYINLRILYSILTEFVTVGPFELNWETQQYKCTLSQFITFGLLASLQAVNLFWLFLILRIAYRFIRTLGDDLEDDRSEYEESEEETEVSGKEKTKKILENASNGTAVETMSGDVKKRR